MPLFCLQSKKARHDGRGVEGEMLGCGSAGAVDVHDRFKPRVRRVTNRAARPHDACHLELCTWQRVEHGLDEGFPEERRECHDADAVEFLVDAFLPPPVFGRVEASFENDEGVWFWVAEWLAFPEDDGAGWEELLNAGEGVNTVEVHMPPPPLTSRLRWATVMAPSGLGAMWRVPSSSTA